MQASIRRAWPARDEALRFTWGGGRQEESRRMPSWTSPPDNHAVGDTGHTTLHNQLADDLNLINAALPVVSGGASGATAAARFVGGTTSGAPVSGAFAKGDFVIDQSGNVWICTTAGAPGTWTLAGTGGGGTMINPMTTAGDMIDASSGGSPQRLPIGSTGQALVVSAGAPAWGSVGFAGGGTGQATQQAAMDALAGAATSGDFLRGNGTHVVMAAISTGDVPQLADYAPTGLTGATAAARFVGGTSSGAPVSGTFSVGDFIVDQSGHVYVCTSAGTPGTWANAGASAGVSTFNSRSGTVTPGNADYLAVASGGLTGATTATRFAGGTASAAPASGTFVTGDFVVAQTGVIFICTAGGSPGTWVNAGSLYALLSGATFTGAIVPAVVSLSFVGSGTTLVNAALGNDFRLTLTASTTTLGNPSNSADGQRIDFQITQGSGGSFTLAYGSAYDFGAAGAPTLTTTAAKVDVLGFIYNAALTKWVYAGSALGA
jgi:hypothetical protein